MNREDLRKVKFRPFDTVDTKKTGYFHQWANSLHSTDSGELAETVAIIEEEDGKVRKVSPHLVEFVN